MTLNARIGIFYGFLWQLWAATQNHHLKGGATVLALVAWRRW